MIERGDYRHKDRYPDPPEPVKVWAGYRRKKGTHDRWDHVEAADAPTKGGCYQKLMQLSELVSTGGEPIQWTYLILPAGQKPPLFDEPGGRMR